MTSQKVFKPINADYKGGYESSSIKNVFGVPYSLSAQQIGAQASAVSATANIYQVPTGYTFFITSCYLQVINNNVVVGVRERAKLRFNGQLFLRLYSPPCITIGVESGTAETSMSFPFPYVLYSGQLVTIESESGAGLAHGGIVGFLVRNADLETK